MLMLDLFYSGRILVSSPGGISPRLASPRFAGKSVVLTGVRAASSRAASWKKRGACKLWGRRSYVQIACFTVEHAVLVSTLHFSVFELHVFIEKNVF